MKDPDKPQLWIEYGAYLNTIGDNEAIRRRLLAILYGVWIISRTTARTGPNNWSSPGLDRCQANGRADASSEWVDANGRRYAADQVISGLSRGTPDNEHLWMSELLVAGSPAWLALHWDAPVTNNQGPTVTRIFTNPALP